MRLMLPLLLLLPQLAACSSTQGGTLEVRLREADFGPLLATELGRVDDLGDVVFNLDQPSAPDDSFGFTLSWTDGNYLVQSGDGDPELYAGEYAHFQYTDPNYAAGSSPEAEGTDGATFSFRWYGNYSEEDGVEYQPAFELDAQDGGACEVDITGGNLRGELECLGLSPTVDGSLVPSGLVELKATWVGSGTPFN